MLMRLCNRFFWIFLLLSFSPSLLRAQADFMMQAWYWDYFQNGNFGTWINNLNAKATALDNAGFKHIWLPPLSRSSTSNNISNGYNPSDLYDLGEFGPACAWGNRTQLNTLITNYNSKGLDVVSDMIYNHRDGGRPEKNEAVRYFITNPSNPNIYPSDRVFYALPLGSQNPGNNGAGDYYIKVRSKSYGFNGSGYKFYARTMNTAYTGNSINESEPNGGGDCGQGSTNTPLGTDILCLLGPDGTGCHTDEFKITLTAGSFNAQDDTLFIYMNNTNGYSDHFIYGIWSAPRSADIVSELEYFTYTNYNNMPSGQGAMNYNSFRPNDATANSGGVTETLGCDWNCPLFFYDYDQAQSSTQTVLNHWTKWQLDQGIKGLRMDAVKHFDPAFVGQMMNYLDAENKRPNMVVGEFFDYSAGALKGWVDAVYANMNGSASGSILVRAFDFALRGELKESCDNTLDPNNGGHDVRSVFQSGMVDGAGGSGFNAVTFIDNHDLRKDGDGIFNDARLAYAYIMTNNKVGLPCVFYPDYYGGQVGNTPDIMLKGEIDNLMSLHNSYIFGSSQVEYLSRYSTPYAQYFDPVNNGSAPSKVLIYQLQPNGSGKNVIVAINFSVNQLDVYQKIRTDWGAGAGTTFTDMLGYSATPTTNITPNQEIHVILPPRSYTVFVQGTLTPLPVDLLNFQVNTGSDQVNLRWESQNERNFSHFEVERSHGDNARFERIGQVQGRNSNALEHYFFTDEKPLFNTPLYYRLRMLDQDGQVKYSPVRSVTLEQRKFRMLLAPNPTSAAEGSSLSIATEQAQDLEFQVLDYLGRVVQQQQWNLEPGVFSYPIRTADLPAGLYRVVVRSAGESEQLSLMVK